jgi:hypothetical protein
MENQREINRLKQRIAAIEDYIIKQEEEKLKNDD